jgi:hypothetical protein
MAGGKELVMIKEPSGEVQIFFPGMFSALHCWV